MSTKDRPKQLTLRKVDRHSGEANIKLQPGGGGGARDRQSGTREKSHKRRDSPRSESSSRRASSSSHSSSSHSTPSRHSSSKSSRRSRSQNKNNNNNNNNNNSKNKKNREPHTSHNSRPSLPSSGAPGSASRGGGRGHYQNEYRAQEAGSGASRTAGRSPPAEHSRDERSVENAHSHTRREFNSQNNANSLRSKIQEDERKGRTEGEPAGDRNRRKVEDRRSRSRSDERNNNDNNHGERSHFSRGKASTDWKNSHSGSPYARKSRSPGTPQHTSAHNNNNNAGGDGEGNNYPSEQVETAQSSEERHTAHNRIEKTLRFEKEGLEEIYLFLAEDVEVNKEIKEEEPEGESSMQEAQEEEYELVAKTIDRTRFQELRRSHIRKMKIDLTNLEEGLQAMEAQVQWQRPVRHCHYINHSEHLLSLECKELQIRTAEIDEVEYETIDAIPDSPTEANILNTKPSSVARTYNMQNLAKRAQEERKCQRSQREQQKKPNSILRRTQQQRTERREKKRQEERREEVEYDELVNSFDSEERRRLIEWLTRREKDPALRMQAPDKEIMQILKHLGKVSTYTNAIEHAKWLKQMEHNEIVRQEREHENRILREREREREKEIEKEEGKLRVKQIEEESKEKKIQESVKAQILQEPFVEINEIEQSVKEEMDNMENKGRFIGMAFKTLPCKFFHGRASSCNLGDECTFIHSPIYQGLPHPDFTLDSQLSAFTKEEQDHFRRLKEMGNWPPLPLEERDVKKQESIFKMEQEQLQQKHSVRQADWQKEIKEFQKRVEQMQKQDQSLPEMAIDPSMIMAFFEFEQGNGGGMTPEALLGLPQLPSLLPGLPGSMPQLPIMGDEFMQQFLEFQKSQTAGYGYVPNRTQTAAGDRRRSGANEDDDEEENDDDDDDGDDEEDKIKQEDGDHSSRSSRSRRSSRERRGGKFRRQRGHNDSPSDEDD